VHLVGVLHVCALNKNNKDNNETIILKVGLIPKLKVGFWKWEEEKWYANINNILLFTKFVFSFHNMIGG
jgi:hypothetical protein